jgi:hypothetical protein
MIEKCAFGLIVIDGRQYTSDLMIYPDGRIVDHWWRSQGHRLTSKDIAELIAAQPQIIVAGTGVSGQMRPDSRLATQLAEDGVLLMAEPNQQAMVLYNQKVEEGLNVGACFHLTC